MKVKTKFSPYRPYSKPIFYPVIIPIYRNRPDLVDWKKVERRQVRERIDLAFHVMEKEYGVTRLLDPEGNQFFLKSLFSTLYIFFCTF